MPCASSAATSSLGEAWRGFGEYDLPSRVSCVGRARPRCRIEGDDLFRDRCVLPRCDPDSPCRGGGRKDAGAPAARQQISATTRKGARASGSAASNIATAPIGQRYWPRAPRADGDPVGIGEGEQRAGDAPSAIVPVLAASPSAICRPAAWPARRISCAAGAIASEAGEPFDRDRCRCRRGRARPERRRSRRRRPRRPVPRRRRHAGQPGRQRQAAQRLALAVSAPSIVERAKLGSSRRRRRRPAAADRARRARGSTTPHAAQSSSRPAEVRGLDFRLVERQQRRRSAVRPTGGRQTPGSVRPARPAR